MGHPDLEELLNALVPFAQQMLSKHGEFYPFGASMNPDGEVAANAADTGDEHPDSQELIVMMMEAFRREAAAGGIRAAGICVDVRTIPPGETEKTDAIKVGLEHQSGEAVDVFIPYEKGFLGKLKYGGLFAAARTPEFFVSSGGQA
jgi:hypothetical protein